MASPTWWMWVWVGFGPGCSGRISIFQFSWSVVLTFCNPMDCCTTGFPVYYQFLVIDSCLLTHVKLMSTESVMSSSHLILIVPSSSCLQSCLASGSFPMSQFFASGGQSIGASTSATVLPVNNQDWFPLGWTGWISLQSKGQSRIFSNTTVQKHQFFGAQFSLRSNSHIHIQPLEKP